MTCFKCTIHLRGDNSAARGIQRQGVGRVRHLSCRILWLQCLVANGVIKLAFVAGRCNKPCRYRAKRLPSSRLRSVMAMLGMLVEGSDDPRNKTCCRF